MTLNLKLLFYTTHELYYYFSYNEAHIRREDATESNIDVQLNVTILNIDRIDTVSIITNTRFS